MIDDDVLTRLAQLHDHIKAPETPQREDVLRGQRRLRRRRAVVAGMATAAVVAALGIVPLATGALQADELLVPAQPGPTQGPTVPAQPGPTRGPTPSPTQWSLERIRAEGSVEPYRMTVTESGITVRGYVVCDGPRSQCESDPPLRVPYQHATLEVTQNGRSALFALGADLQYLVTEFGADAVLVIDDPLLATPSDFTDQAQKRYRVLRADGTAVLLDLLDDLAPAVPGPGVLVVDYAGSDRTGLSDIFLVDERAGTLRPLDVPHRPPAGSIRSGRWGPNVDEFLWFVDGDCRVAWTTDGTFQEHRPACAPGYEAPTYIRDEWFPEGWLEPGRMAMLERSADRLFLHVSLDVGSTWQRIAVEDEQAILGTLRRLG